jgi:hypothetical protein
MTIAEIKTALKENAAARKANADAIAEYGTRNCAAVTRLHDARWFLEARGDMLCRMFDAAA